MKTAIIFFIIFVLSSSCITTRSERMRSWLGKDVNQLIYSKWGYPNETKVAHNGNKLLVYEKIKTELKRKSVYKPRYSKHGKLLKGTRESVNYTVEKRCLYFFEIDNNDKVRNVHWRCN